MSRPSLAALYGLVLLSNALAVLLFVVVLCVFRFDLTNLFVLIALPFGACLFGMLATLGAVPGAKLSQVGPSESLRKIMIITSIGSLAVYFAVLASILNWADPAHPGLLAALVHHETQSEFLLTKGIHEIGNLGETGAWGYLLFTLKFLGAGAGAWTTYSLIALLPYCKTCRVFTRTRDKSTLHFRSLDIWAGEMAKVPEGPTARARYMLKLPRQKAFSVSGHRYVLVRLRRHECPCCNEQHMRERVFVHDGSRPVEQKSLSIEYSWWPQRAARVTDAAVPLPRVRTFGRKSVR